MWVAVQPTASSNSWWHVVCCRWTTVLRFNHQVDHETNLWFLSTIQRNATPELLKQPLNRHLNTYIHFDRHPQSSSFCSASIGKATSRRSGKMNNPGLSNRRTQKLFKKKRKRVAAIEKTTKKEQKQSVNENFGHSIVVFFPFCLCLVMISHFSLAGVVFFPITATRHHLLRLSLFGFLWVGFSHFKFLVWIFAHFCRREQKRRISAHFLFTLATYFLNILQFSFFVTSL